MSDTGGMAEPELDPATLANEYAGLLQFIHMAPVGLIQADREGRIHLMNPMAMQLLAPLIQTVGMTKVAQRDEPLQLFEILNVASSDLHTLFKVFSGHSGTIVNNYQLQLPPRMRRKGSPEALSVTAMLVERSQHGLMVVVTDDTENLRMQRLQATWRR